MSEPLDCPTRLEAYLFRDVTQRDATRFITGENGQRVRILTGTLHTTYKYPLAGSVEIGFGGDGAPGRKDSTSMRSGASPS